MSDELAGIHDRLVAIESALGVGAARRRRFRFSLQALFWLLALAAAISFTTVEHLKTRVLEEENAKLKAEIAKLEASNGQVQRALAQMFRERTPRDLKTSYLEKENARLKEEIAKREIESRQTLPESKP
jgi:hypothetical protein